MCCEAFRGNPMQYAKAAQFADLSAEGEGLLLRLSKSLTPRICVKRFPCEIDFVN